MSNINSPNARPSEILYNVRMANIAAAARKVQGEVYDKAAFEADVSRCERLSKLDNERFIRELTEDII